MENLEKYLMKKSELPANRITPDPVYKDLEVLCNYRRLMFTRRFNNLHTNHTEDVAQHSFYTTIIAMTLAEEYNDSVEKYNESVREHNLQLHTYDVENQWKLKDTVNINQVMVQALYHDIEESFTSDIPWNVKHHSEEVNTAIKHATWDKLKSIYRGCSPTIKKHMNLNISAKKEIEGKFVEIADMVECAWNCYQEEQMGNSYLVGMKLKAIKEIEEMELYVPLMNVSPLFKAIMSMFRGIQNTVECDEMILD